MLASRDLTQNYGHPVQPKELSFEELTQLVDAK